MSEELTEATIEGVALDLMFRGASSGALVGPNSVSVFILTARVAFKLRGLEALSEKLMTARDWNAGGINAKGGIGQIEKVFEAAPQDFFGFAFEIGNQKVVVLCFRGESRKVAANILNANGCPCSLDPLKAAPGYEGRTDVRGGGTL